jgi:hypothetical protein
MDLLKLVVRHRLKLELCFFLDGGSSSVAWSLPEPQTPGNRQYINLTFLVNFDYIFLFILE